MASLRQDTTSLRKQHAHMETAWELQTNRWFVREGLSGVKTYQKRIKPRKAKPWKILESM